MLFYILALCAGAVFLPWGQLESDSIIQILLLLYVDGTELRSVAQSEALSHRLLSPPQSKFTWAGASDS